MARFVGVAPSASRSADFISPMYVNSEDNVALALVVDITLGSPNLVVAVKGNDLTSGKSYTILQSAALNAAATTVLRVGPGLTAAANLVANDYIPDSWFVSVTQSGGVPATYSIGASLI